MQYIRLHLPASSSKHGKKTTRSTPRIDTQIDFLKAQGEEAVSRLVLFLCFLLLNHVGWNLFLENILEDGSNLTVLMRMNLRTKLGADNKSTESIYCSDELMPTPRKTWHFPKEVLLRIGHHALAARSRNTELHPQKWIQRLYLKDVEGKKY